MVIDCCEPLLPDDILCAILVAASETYEGTTFRAHEHVFQKLFRELQPEYPALLSRFVFSDNGPEPHSTILGESFRRLSLYGIVRRYDSDDSELLRVEPQGYECFTKILSRLKDDERCEPPRLVEEVQRRIPRA